MRSFLCHPRAQRGDPVSLLLIASRHAIEFLDQLDPRAVREDDARG